MSKTKSTQARGKYTLEFKLEAVRLVRKGQSVAVTAKTLGIPGQTLDNWMRLQAKGVLQGAGDRPVTAEQMELSRPEILTQVGTAFWSKSVRGSDRTRYSYPQ